MIFCIAATTVKSTDVTFLVARLHNYAFRWREIGTALGFQHGELENIRHSLPGANTQRLLTELLSQWSQWPTVDYPQPPTIERLCDALRSSLVGLGAEANSLYAKRTDLPSQLTGINKWSYSKTCLIQPYRKPV